MPGAADPVPAVHSARQPQLRIEKEELARDDRGPVLQTGMIVDHPAESVGPAVDQFVAADRRRMAKDTVCIKCALFYSPEIVE